jgi:hypothetical protein
MEMASILADHSEAAPHAGLKVYASQNEAIFTPESNHDYLVRSLEESLTSVIWQATEARELRRTSWGNGPHSREGSFSQITSAGASLSLNTCTLAYI